MPHVSQVPAQMRTWPHCSYGPCYSCCGRLAGWLPCDLGSQPQNGLSIVSRFAAENVQGCSLPAWQHVCKPMPGPLTSFCQLHTGQPHVWKSPQSSACSPPGSSHLASQQPRGDDAPPTSRLGSLLPVGCRRSVPRRHHLVQPGGYEASRPSVTYAVTAKRRLKLRKTKSSDV